MAVNHFIKINLCVIKLATCLYTDKLLCLYFLDLHSITFLLVCSFKYFPVLYTCIYIYYRSKKETLLARIYIHCFVVYKVYIANKRKHLFFFILLLFQSCHKQPVWLWLMFVYEKIYIDIIFYIWIKKKIIEASAC
jgi:hypothetical protein